MGEEVLLEFGTKGFPVCKYYSSRRRSAISTEATATRFPFIFNDIIRNRSDNICNLSGGDRKNYRSDNAHVIFRSTEVDTLAS